MKINGRILGLIILLGGIGAFATSKAIGSKSGSPNHHEPKAMVLNEYLENSVSDTSSLEGLDKRVRSFLQQWEIKGASLAIMRNDSLVYAKGYGWADEVKKEEMQPYNLLRVASVSKLVTAAGIMVLQEQGKLNLDDKIFGEGGILSSESYASSVGDKNYHKITVEHLLRHQGGFTSRAGDPLFSTRSIMANNGLKAAPDNETLLNCVLRRRLSFMPGTSQAYSNLGYLLLSEVIRKCSGMEYEDFISKYVLKKAGCHDFHIANNYYNEKFKNEVRYYVPSNESPVPEFNNSGKMVTRCYGGNDIHSLSGAGAWVASVPELMRFVASIDGKEGVPDIISKESLDAMIEYFDEATFSLGWNDTKPSMGWSRSGSFSGTSAMIRYYPDGECWIMVTNTSSWKGSSFSRTIAGLFSELRRNYSSSLPARDLFHK